MSGLPPLRKGTPEKGKVIVTIASGKGGTGKTMVATSLVASLSSTDSALQPLFMDCDVEAPNGHLFLDPNIEAHQKVTVLIPQVDERICTHCGRCAQVCQYHAIAVLGKKTLVFPQLCHGCGSCMAVCPERALSKKPIQLGIVERGRTSSGVIFAQGLMDVGESMAIPIIRKLKKWVLPKPHQIVIRDAPPGTSCPVVETMRGSDYLILVTEPTPFGLHDLCLAVEAAEILNLPVGVVINRENGVYPAMDEYLSSHKLPVLLRIPFQREISEGLARGCTLIDLQPEYKTRFLEMFQTVVTAIS